MKKIKNTWIIFAKALIFLIIYTLFHFAYEVWPLPVFAVSEAVWEHLKIGFFAAIFLNLLEIIILWRKNKIYSITQWMFSRLISIMLIAPILFMFFYLKVEMFGKITPVSLEVAAVVLMTYLAGLLAFYTENEILDFALYRKHGLFILLTIFFIINIYLFILYTYTEPFYPLFTERRW